jgi:hypothetical protein
MLLRASQGFSFPNADASAELERHAMNDDTMMRPFILLLHLFVDE